ncbi:hypothetical protein X975_00919, partial [Stegodyphus mimosarum]
MMRKVCAQKFCRWIRRNCAWLFARKKLQWLNVDPNLLEKVVTSDETWVYEYDPESKRQSSEWHTASS